MLKNRSNKKSIRIERTIYNRLRLQIGSIFAHLLTNSLLVKRNESLNPNGSVMLGHCLKRSPAHIDKVFIVSLLLLLFIPIVSKAFTVSPPVLDLELTPEETQHEKITITNNYDRTLHLFVFAQDVKPEPQDSSEEFSNWEDPEPSESVRDWISIPPSNVKISAGESKELPITVTVDRNADPGTYHAFIYLAEGNRRFEARERISRDLSVLLTIKVEDTAEDILRLSGFATTEGYMISGSPIEFQVDLTNQGDTDLQPTGELIIYNNDGQEVNSIPFNSEDYLLTPKEQREFSLIWDDEVAWGHHRARLVINYGTRGERYSIDDTVSLLVLPITSLIIIFLLCLIILIYFTHRLHRYLEKKHQERLPMPHQINESILEYSPSPDTIDLRNNKINDNKNDV